MPAHLVWQDALPLAGLIALGLFRGHPHPAALLTTFGFTYLLLTTVALFNGGASFAALLVLVGLPTVLLPEVNGWWATGVIAGVYAISAVGTREMLARFPWAANATLRTVGRHVTKLNQNVQPEP